MTRRGEVFIAPDGYVPRGAMVDPATARFAASWQDEGAEGLVEDVVVEGAEAAIAWGRSRSSMIWIRLGHTGDTYFSAGAEHPAGGDEEPVLHWPPQSPPEAGWWVPGPAPGIGDVDRVAARVAAGELTLIDAQSWADEQLSVHRLELDDETFRALARFFDTNEPIDLG